MSKITAEEKIEQAAHNYAKVQINRTSHMRGFINGANWQKEQMQEHTKQHIEALRIELKLSTPYPRRQKTFDKIINEYLDKL